ncbi:hypothetical protein DFH28DRAFT_1085702 [Melampsora americana]|nr:hypothetical protein DFH28DRAFT_1085702 [Melampsora americana]
MASQSPKHSLTTIQQSTMRRANSTRSNTSSRSVRNGDSKQKEDLINALEAEEERLVNTLTRKLEKLCAEKVELKNVLEAESESLVLRLQRLTFQSSQPSSSTAAIAAPATSPPGGPNMNALINNPDPLHPLANTLIEVLKTENSNLRNRLVDTEREYIKTSQQSDVVGLPINDLIGAIPTFEENYPAARRRSRGASASGNGIPIPGMTSSNGRRRAHHTASISSSSIQLPSSFFTPSTPMTPSSITDSANAISSSFGTTNFTTPSTSYPGLPVPHSTPAATPAASPANGRQQNVSTATDNHPTGHCPGLSLTTGANDDSTSSTYPHPANQSPVSPVSRCNSKSRPVGPNKSDTGGMSSERTQTMTVSTSQSPKAGAPGRPESRQQPPI